VELKREVLNKISRECGEAIRKHGINTDCDLGENILGLFSFLEIRLVPHQREQPVLVSQDEWKQIVSECILIFEQNGVHLRTEHVRGIAHALIYDYLKEKNYRVEGVR
jgi:hypothetical protein